MLLDLSSYKKCIQSLESAIIVYRQYEQNSCDLAVIQAIRAGVVQNFEFTYEQAWKYMKRWLDLNIGATVVDGVTRRELFRIAAESRLLEDVDAWMRFHQARNITSHTYDAAVSAEVAQVAVEFLQHAKDLLARLEAHNT